MQGTRQSAEIRPGQVLNQGRRGVAYD